MRSLRRVLAPLLLCALVLATRYAIPAVNTADPAASSEELPAYAGEPWVEVNGNEPGFDQSELTTESFESYSPLDALGRCGTAYASIGPDLMPTEERGAIGQVKPSGWQLAKYDIVDGKYLYNRCHLIGYQLTGENANEQNLITGTRYLNIDGMLSFENQVADYIRETSNHVLYRVTPDFQGSELVARGVWMEALSVEDGGEGVRFHIYAYNVQPGVTIDYATGESHLTDEAAQETEEAFTYILNARSMKFHDPGCSGAKDIKENNRQSYTGSREDLLAQGYSPCGQCQP